MLFFSVGVPPTAVTIGETTTSKIPVTWTDPNGEAASYRLNCTCNADGCQEDHQVTDTPSGACEKLTPGTEYTITVSAIVHDIEYAADEETDFTS